MDDFDIVAQLENVGLRYGLGPEVLRDITLTLSTGSFHFLTGASGAGKSSLMRLLYLAQRPSRGIVSLFGRDVTELARRELSELRRRIGVVFQDFRLLRHLSAFDNVALPLRVAGVREGEIRKHVTELLEWVALTEHMDSLPSTMSGGQQQRVAIARAVITRPRLLLADEPTGNVDERIALRLMRLFDELNKLGTTIVIASHNQGLVEHMHRPTLHLDAGRLTVRRGGAAGADPANSDTAEVRGRRGTAGDRRVI
jgi:cell division transport system ATP-binding protein